MSKDRTNSVRTSKWFRPKEKCPNRPLLACLTELICIGEPAAWPPEKWLPSAHQLYITWARVERTLPAWWVSSLYLSFTGRSLQLGLGQSEMMNGSHGYVPPLRPDLK